MARIFSIFRLAFHSSSYSTLALLPSATSIHITDSKRMGEETHLHSDNPIINHQLSSQKVCANGSLVLCRKSLVDVLVHERSLADATLGTQKLVESACFEA